MERDREGDLEGALKLYRSALEYYVPLLHDDKFVGQRDALRDRITGYLKRAEKIKEQLGGDESTASFSRQASSTSSHVRLEPRSSKEESRYQELRSLCSMTPKLLIGLEIAHAAEQYELEGKYSTALDKYKSALNILLPLLQSEPRGSRRSALSSEVNRWMNRAECVKEVMQTQEKVLEDARLMVAEDPSEGVTGLVHSCQTRQGGPCCHWCAWKKRVA